MMSNRISYLAGSAIREHDRAPAGSIVTRENEQFYLLENYDAMPPFLMSIVSDSDHWMFISSSGGMTAGRKNSDHAIFPYYTDDKIHEASGSAGSKTILRIHRDDRVILWEPFNRSHDGLYVLQRNLYKNLKGNSIWFEEINHDLSLKIVIRWMNSDRFGWVRQTEVKNIAEDPVRVEMLDGLCNILPAGILKSTQETFSTLMDAYKKAELHEATQTAIFSLSSVPVDRPEPSEALTATVAWNTAEHVQHVLLGDVQLEEFRMKGKINTEATLKGTRCSYLINNEINLAGGETSRHMIVSDTGLSAGNVHDLLANTGHNAGLEKEVLEDVKAGSRNLERMVADADGIQLTADREANARHFSNVLFNIMRGGIFLDDYRVRIEDLEKHVKTFNRDTYQRFKKWFEGLEDPSDYRELVRLSEKTGNTALQRLVTEYLPLTFSRRHGDPSRPWNRFSIEVKKDDGSRSTAYEGNWRDIFQNWEALAYSYPEYLQGFIFRFINASTIDGYNPYRITSEGIDWEIFEPENPWSFIGYWGDHQVIYLLKLLELQESFHPGTVLTWLNTKIFAYAAVPYRIKPYREIIKNPNKTIDFDTALHQEIEKRVRRMGADGKLILDNDKNIVYATLAEKLLVMLLTKLSNFIPGAGIWMNTQRPEWNDANNALVGNGVSMVTLFYLRRFLSFASQIFSAAGEKEMEVSEEIHTFFSEIMEVFQSGKELFTSMNDGAARREITDQLGEAGSRYRTAVYSGPSGDIKMIPSGKIAEFAQIALDAIDHTIEANKRNDGLYHAYNLVSIHDKEISIERLQEMLEGQVAFLGSGKPNAEETIEVLNALRHSKLYREDQDSYMLYPDKPFESFLDKNSLAPELKRKSPAITKLLSGGGYGIIHQDNSGKIHFSGPFRNASLLEEALTRLVKPEEPGLTQNEIAEVLEIYESLFNHHAFTGRSGSFYKYEGLGSIYWHMVSKLQLVTFENMMQLVRGQAPAHQVAEIRRYYNEIREGVGVHKNPAEYGAIPTDPYSHTPSMMGAQQPGMTGQVKEDIISRLMELGIEITGGQIRIHPGLISPQETGEQDELSFTLCKVPFRYIRGSRKGIRICLEGGGKKEVKDYLIDRKISAKIFSRSTDIQSVEVGI